MRLTPLSLLRTCALASAFVSTALLGACKKPVPLETIAGVPAMWEVSDADTTVYLYGTIHVLRPDLNWETANLKEALKKSDAIYFEADTSAEAAKSIQDTIQRLAYFPKDQTIYDVLDDTQKAELEVVTETLQAPMLYWDRMKPWMLAMSLYQLQNTEIGYFDSYGVENVIEKMPEAKGKTYRYLTPLATHLGYLGNLEEDVQIEFLMSGLDDLPGMEAEVNNLVRAWLLGDVQGLDDIVNQSETFLDKIIYDVLIVERNQDWVEKIDALIDNEAGTFFIAVGAAHLTGKDSVQLGLEAKGQTVTRVQ